MMAGLGKGWQMRQWKIILNWPEPVGPKPVPGGNGEEKGEDHLPTQDTLKFLLLLLFSSSSVKHRGLKVVFRRSYAGKDK